MPTPHQKPEIRSFSSARLKKAPFSQNNASHFRKHRAATNPKHHCTPMVPATSKRFRGWRLLQ
jgi:hypothetical protein